MSYIHYITGTILGPWELTYISEDRPKLYKSSSLKRQGLFHCKCEKDFIGDIAAVKRGSTRDCGCGINGGQKKHGFSNTRIRRCWVNMKSRCFCRTSTGYKHYGARGITVYPPWVHDFKSFYTYVSKLPNFKDPLATLDRIENDGNYEPGNLRWAGWQTQANNKRPRVKSISPKTINNKQHNG